MVNPDTIKLLKECNAGIKMGVNSINEVFDNVESDEFRKILNDSRDEHQRLGSKTHEMLNDYDDEGKEPNPMARSMSWLKTNIKLTVNESDKTIADLMTSGCDMGVKSLNKYLNEYKAADEVSKDITKKLINLEERLTVDIRDFL